MPAVGPAIGPSVPGGIVIVWPPTVIAYWDPEGAIDEPMSFSSRASSRRRSSLIGGPVKNASMISAGTEVCVDSKATM
jgi:hypothetical protein